MMTGLHQRLYHWNPYGIHMESNEPTARISVKGQGGFTSRQSEPPDFHHLLCPQILEAVWNALGRVLPEGNNMKKHQLILKKRENVTTWPPPKNWQNDKLAQFTPTHFGINSGSTDSPECSPTSSWYAARSSLCSTSSRFGQHDTWHCSM